MGTLPPPEPHFPLARCAAPLVQKLKNAPPTHKEMGYFPTRQNIEERQTVDMRSVYHFYNQGANEDWINPPEIL